MIIRPAIIALACLGLVACEKPPERRVRSSNDDFDVQMLFSVDGCRVYRFKDADFSYPIYFSTCAGKVSTTEKVGKTSRPVEVPTGAVP